MKKSSVCQKTFLLASLCTALAATGCASSESDDLDVTDDETAAVAATPASLVTQMASSVAGAIGGAAATRAFNAIGLFPTVSLSNQSLQQIAGLVGKSVRSDFYNKNNAEMNSLYDLSSEYGRSCVEGRSCNRSILESDLDDAKEIVRRATDVYNFYVLDAYKNDRLVFAPQLQNALMIRTGFLVEVYKTSKLLAPGGNHSELLDNASRFAGVAIGYMDDLKTRFDGYVLGRVSEIRRISSGGSHGGVRYRYCYTKDGQSRCSTDGGALRTERNREYEAIVNSERPRILSDKFDTIRGKLAEISAW